MDAMAETPPLHRVIDAGRWDAERLLGRLIIVVHASFLHVGFLLAYTAAKSGLVPRWLGATASTLPLRYAAPQLLHLRRAVPADAAAVLRMHAHGGHVVFYVRVRSARRGVRPGLHWACVDAAAAASLLAGGLDDTARALTLTLTLTSDAHRPAATAALWRELTQNLCRSALVDLCRENGVVLRGVPTFMSLPRDTVLAILARLADGVDLASVESTCTQLRHLVADHDVELWKPRCKASRSSNSCDETMSWKQRYARDFSRQKEIEKIIREMAMVREIGIGRRQELATGGGR